MTTATVNPPAKTSANGTAVAPAPKQQENVISYVPLGESEQIHLTLSRVKQFLCVPTKSGAMPTDEQVVKFMMLCKAQTLNPWVSDCFLVGYDSKDGPQFSLITAHQALLKRAEASPQFNGMESGVVVADKDGVIKDRQGDLVLPGETLVGGWARVHRRDREIPSYDALNLKTFNTGRSRWAADPAGQICKCAEASALRKAFPSTLGAMYLKEEMERNRMIEQEHSDAIVTESKPKTERLTERLLGSSQSSSPLQSSSIPVADLQKASEQVEQQPAEENQPIETPAVDTAEVIKFWQTRIDACKTPADLETEYPRFDAVRSEMVTETADAIEAAFAARMDAMNAKK